MITVKELRGLVQKVVEHSMERYQLHHQGQPVIEKNGQKEMTVGEHSIKENSTLAITRMGLVLNVTNPMVSPYMHAVFHTEGGSPKV